MEFSLQDGDKSDNDDITYETDTNEDISLIDTDQDISLIDTDKFSMVSILGTKCSIFCAYETVKVEISTRRIKTNLKTQINSASAPLLPRDKLFFPHLHLKLEMMKKCIFTFVV